MSKKLESGTAILEKKSKTTETSQEKQLKEVLEERRAAVIERVNAYAFLTFEELHLASRAQTQELLNGVRNMQLNEQEIEGWEHFVAYTIPRLEQSAHALYGSFFEMMGSALRDKVISYRVYEKKVHDFFSENVEYKSKEYYVESTFKERMKEWRSVKEKRDELVKHPDINHVKNAKIDHVSALFHPDMFADLRWPARKKLVEEAEALLHAKLNDTESLMPAIRSQLEAYAREECILHPSKVSTWMRRIFTRNTKPEDIAAFMKNVLAPYADNWRAAKRDFDRVNKQMAGNVPRGFKPVKEEAFLKMDYKKRTSYCALAWTRLENAHEEDRTLAALKLRIRYHLDTEDWDDAQKDIDCALALRKDDRELLSMQRFLHCHRPEEADEEKKTSVPPVDLWRQLESYVDMLPGSLQSLYVKAMEDDTGVFLRLQQLMYNDFWLHEVAGWTEKDKDAHVARQRMTVPRQEETLLDPVEMGEDAVLNKIRRNASTSAGKTAPNLSGKERWGYNTSIWPKNVPYERIRMVVMQLHHPMKKALMELKKQGYGYSRTGIVPRN